VAKVIKKEIRSAVGLGSELIAHKDRREGANPDAKRPDRVVVAEDEGTASEDAARIGPQEGFVEGLRVIRGDGKSSYTGDVTADGTVIESMAGPAPSTEVGELRTMRILIERLNLDGENWGPPWRETGPERGVDCVADNLADADHQLLVQVTMPPESVILRALGTGALVPRSRESAEAVGPLYEALKEKHRKDLKYREVREGKRVVLAVDATHLSGYSFRSAVGAFREVHGRWAATLGFEAIWLVGPTAQMTYRIDS